MNEGQVGLEGEKERMLQKKGKEKKKNAWNAQVRRRITHHKQRRKKRRRECAEEENKNTDQH